MKNVAAILALCAFQPSAAFVMPTATSFKSWKNAGATSPSFSSSTMLGSTTGKSTSAADTVSAFYNATKASSTSAPVSDFNYTVRAPKHPSHYPRFKISRNSCLISHLSLIHNRKYWKRKTPPSNHVKFKPESKPVPPASRKPRRSVTN